MNSHSNHRAIVLRALCLVACLVGYSTDASAYGTQGGNVLSPDRKPYGYTLDAMAQELAIFDASGSTQLYPATPFQILHVQSTAADVKTCAIGLQGYKVTGTGAFPVTEGVTYFVPIFSVDDSPPIVGTFPDTKAKAPGYVYGADNFNASGIRITVDGRSTAVGPQYLGGLAFVPDPGLPDGGGHHLIQIGVFVSPMSIGRHTVRIRGELGNSQAFVDAFGFACLEEDMVYAVTVLPALRY